MGIAAAVLGHIFVGIGPGGFGPWELLVLLVIGGLVCGLPLLAVVVLAIVLSSKRSDRE